MKTLISTKIMRTDLASEMENGDTECEQHGGRNKGGGAGGDNGNRSGNSGESSRLRVGHSEANTKPVNSQRQKINFLLTARLER